MTPQDSAPTPEEAALRAARRAGVRVSTDHDLDAIEAMSALWRDVWHREQESPVGADLLRAMSHAGSYLSAAYEGDRLVGALLGFLGGRPGNLHLHSHILGVDPALRRRGVGFALKVHQRMWALQAGIDEVEWTFDPLVRANGYFNLAKLGADGVRYLVNFYGPMRDAINGDEDSDRVLVRWSLRAPDVAEAAGGRPREADAAELLRGGAEVALATLPSGAPERRTARGDVILCHTPEDIVSLRRRDVATAHAWRVALRDAVGDAMSRGLRMTAMTRDGWYVVSGGPG